MPGLTASLLHRRFVTAWLVPQVEMTACRFHPIECLVQQSMLEPRQLGRAKSATATVLNPKAMARADSERLALGHGYPLFERSALSRGCRHHGGCLSRSSPDPSPTVTLANNVRSMNVPTCVWNLVFGNSQNTRKSRDDFEHNPARQASALALITELA